MNNYFNFSFLLITLSVFSCNYEHDKNAHGRLIKTLIQVNEKINEDINVLQKNINRNMTKMSFCLRDPKLKATTMKVQPINMQISYLTNSLDDLLLFKLNELIEKEENESDWFTKDIHSKRISYKELNKLNHIDGSAWSTILLGNNSDLAITNSELIRNSIHTFRNNLILALAAEGMNWKSEPIYIVNKDLTSYKSFEIHLKEIWHPWKAKLLMIYAKLSIPEDINDSGVAKKWNNYSFNNQPLVGSISTFNFLRKDIKECQNIAGEILVNEILSNEDV